jgi:hypothetical protein
VLIFAEKRGSAIILASFPKRSLSSPALSWHRVVECLLATTDFKNGTAMTIWAETRRKFEIRSPLPAFLKSVVGIISYLFVPDGCSGVREKETWEFLEALHAFLLVAFPQVNQSPPVADFDEVGFFLCQPTHDGSVSMPYPTAA